MRNAAVPGRNPEPGTSRESTQPIVEVVLSTYNGGAYLREQLDSILAQSHGDWRLLVRDDGSSDDTREILAAYVQRHRDRIRLVDPAGENLGACQSFGRLLEFTTADYLMFSDQDDVWHPDKMALTLARMQALEAEHGRGRPGLVFSDATVVDERLRVIAPSLWRYQRSDPALAGRLNRLLLMNPANGCTMMINRALLQRALPIPPAALMHDYWLALVAAGFGTTAFLTAPTLLYRQHGRNELGARRWGWGRMLGQLRQLPAVRQAMARNRSQAQALRECDPQALSGSDDKLLAAFVGLPGRSFWGKRWDICRYRLFYVGLARNLGWICLC